MSDQIKRQAAGPGGPASLRSLRNEEIEASTAAVRAACRDLLVEGTVRPSITKVATRSGCSISTVNRNRCKTILADYRRRYDMVATGIPLEEVLVLTEEAVLDHFTSDDIGTGPEVEPEVAQFQARVARLEGEVERRDGQLYLALGIISSIRSTLRWHRADRSRLLIQLEALGEKPLEPRIRRKWREDFEAEALGTHFEDEDEDGDADALAPAAAPGSGRARAEPIKGSGSAPRARSPADRDTRAAPWRPQRKPPRKGL